MTQLRRWATTRAPWLLGAAMFGLCLLFVPEYPTEWDSVQLTLGVDRFDVTMDSPHPPGYWLYIALGRLVRWLTPLNATTSLSVLSAAAAGATVGLTYAIGERVGGRWLGLAAAAFLATSPFLLFYGAIVATYAFDALIASVVVALAMHARRGSWHAWAAAGALGLGAGLRQSALLILGPVVLAAVVRTVRTWRAGFAVAAAGAVGVLVWAVPMLLEQPGGLDRYREYSNRFYEPALTGSSILLGAPRTGVVENLGETTAYTLGSVLVLVPVALVGVLLFLRARHAGRLRVVEPADDRGVLLLWLVVGMSLALLLLVHFGKAGYVLALLPALVLLLLRPVARLPRPERGAVTALLALACLLDFQRFVSAAGILPLSLANQESIWFTQERHGAPFRLTKPLIDQTDRETRALLGLRHEYDPARDVLVFVMRDGGHRFRHANLALPEFTAHFAADGVHRLTFADGRTSHAVDSRLEVPPGGRAVWVLDVALRETAALEAAGRIERRTVDTGLTVWVTPPGTTMLGLTVVEAPA